MGTVTPSQSACQHPDAIGALPETIRPPLTRRAVIFALGLKEPAMIASGLSAKNSVCASSVNRLASHESSLLIDTTQPVDPQPLPSSWYTALRTWSGNS